MRFEGNGPLEIQPAQLFNKVIFSQIAFTRGHQLVDCGPDTDLEKYLSGLNTALKY